MTRQQRQVVFSGDVQGVGFRYTACRIADRYEINGYVRNLPDGCVECLLEGDSGQIDAFVTDLGEAMGGHIRGQNQQTAPYGGKLTPFTVRY